MPMVIHLTLPPHRYVTMVAELLAQPGHRFARTARTANTRPQCRQNRLNPVSAVSPVASVYRSISMFRKNCVARPTSAAQTNTRPTWEAMYGKRMNSPDARPTPAAMMPGPMMRQVDAGGSGSGLISGLARYFVGNRSATEVDTSLCCLVMCLHPLSCMLYAKW